MTHHAGQNPSVTGLRKSGLLGIPSKVRNNLVLKAFIDDSGSDDANTHFVLGGVLSTAEVWRDVEMKWKECRDRWGIGYFKMSEAHGCKGQFDAWSKEPGDRRDECVGEFLAIASNEYLRTEGVYIAKADAKRVFAGYPLFDEAQQSSYPMLFLALCHMLRMKANFWNFAHKSRHPLMCVFDKQSGPGRVIQEMERHLGQFPVDAWTHEDSKLTVEIQVADMFAWAVRRHAEFGSKGKPTRVYEALVTKKGNCVTEITRKLLGTMDVAEEAVTAPPPSPLARASDEVPSEEGLP